MIVYSKVASDESLSRRKHEMNYVAHYTQSIGKLHCNAFSKNQNRICEVKSQNWELHYNVRKQSSKLKLRGHELMWKIKKRNSCICTPVRRRLAFMRCQHTDARREAQIHACKIVQIEMRQIGQLENIKCRAPIKITSVALE